MQSLDRHRAGVSQSRGVPNTNPPRKDSRLNYNSSSIPYLNKRGGGVAQGMGHGQPIVSQEM